MHVPPAGRSVPTDRPRVAGPPSAVLALRSAAGNAAVQRLLAQRYLDGPGFEHSDPPDFGAFRDAPAEAYQPAPR